MSEIIKIRDYLVKDLTRKKFKMEELKQEIKDSKCTKIGALSTFGYKCYSSKKAIEEMKTIKQRYEHELNIGRALLTKVVYFEGFTGYDEHGTTVPTQFISHAPELGLSTL